MLEVKCNCSRDDGVTKRIEVDRGNIQFDLCLDCFQELANGINQILLELLNLGEEPNISKMGVLCDQCNHRKVGAFHRITSLSFKMFKSVDNKGNVVSQTVSPEHRNTTTTYFVCDDCFQEGLERKFFIKSGRDVYISESLDQTVENLFSSLEKTGALFTLVPTEVMRRVLKPSLEAPKEVEK